MGAREVTRGEVETDFSNKVWFNWDTEHIVKYFPHWPDSLPCFPLSE